MGLTYYKQEDDMTGGWWVFSNTAFIIFFLLVTPFIIGLSGFIICNVAPETTEFEKVSDFNIVALSDSTNIHGRFYLTGSYIEEDLYYIYMRNTSKGLKQGKMRADNTYVNYTDGRPHVKYYKQVFKDDIWWVKILTDVDLELSGYYYVAYVPEGTVEKDFRIDLE